LFFGLQSSEWRAEIIFVGLVVTEQLILLGGVLKIEKIFTKKL